MHFVVGDEAFGMIRHESRLAPYYDRRIFPCFDLSVFREACEEFRKLCAVLFVSEGIEQEFKKSLVGAEGYHIGKYCGRFISETFDSCVCQELSGIVIVRRVEKLLAEIFHGLGCFTVSEMDENGSSSR